MSLKGSEIVESVSFLNENFDILNAAKFGDLSTVKTILVIQVIFKMDFYRNLKKVS